MYFNQIKMDNKENLKPEEKNAQATKNEFALGRQNYLLIAISFILIVVGFVLMMGGGSTDEAYNPDIFSTRRIVIAPTITFIGFVCIIFAILRKPKN